ncbi:MBL fold metallo-hydrolase [Ferruginibacter sp. SUN002]|uniref:MBL fold metallo-hydrolase n=1 Tax=Ferruginibacter sp. SUN002 TaxID=2937789 RepID=UPI003D363807
MSLFITSLNSGSNGNCYYVGNHTDAVLVDVGLSCRETEKRMKRLGLSMQTVKAIFVSHEHGDHIKGVSTLANKYKLPVYITEHTAKNGPILIGHLSKRFFANEPVTVGTLTVTPFAKKHDAIDPHSFIISHNKITVGVFTDIGIVCDQVINYFRQCHAIFLEANYDDAMLENGRYPLHLKNRIRGGEGHLSNDQAFDLFVKHRPPFMSHLILSHLSKENNTPEIASALFAPHANDIKVIVASRYEPTQIFTVTADPNTIEIKTSIHVNSMQLGLF